MEIGKTLYVTQRNDWRKWLKENHNKEPEIWLIAYRKVTGKPSILYNDAVEEALCFGWIDSIVKKLDDERSAQRYTPRKPKSPWSQMNKERAKRLTALGKMTPAGFATLPSDLNHKFVIPDDISKGLKKDKVTWQNFQKFPDSYKRIRIGWIDGARKRPEVFKQRLKYFLKMTSQNKKFGMVQ